jgi:hypothetical protein
MLTTDQKGAIAEMKIAAHAAELGIGVWGAYTVERYDLIFDLRPELWRVQCKWACRYGDVVIVRCRSHRRNRDGFVHRRYSRDEVDAFAAYCAELNQCYFLPLTIFDEPTRSSCGFRRPETTSDGASIGRQISSSRLH